MPWHIEEGHAECPEDRSFAVVKDADDSVAGCHDTRASAEAQLAALYAQEAEQAALSAYVAASVALGGPPNPGTKPDKRLHENKCDSDHKLVDGKCVPKYMSLEMFEFLATEDDTAVGDLAVQPWRGTWVVEGAETGDGREFAAGSLQWDQDPDAMLPLSWQEELLPAHEGAVVIGRATHLERVGNEIKAWGQIDIGSELGREVVRKIRAGFAGGVSVNVDAVKNTDVELVYDNDNEDNLNDDSFADLFAPPDRTIFHGGRIRGATLVELPAVYPGAKIELIDAAPKTEANVIAVTAGAEPPAHPPREWFTDPKLSGPTPWTVTEDGRVYGHLALNDSCHLTFPNKCVTPPREDEHAYYTTRTLTTQEGDKIATGVITFDTGHASLQLGAVPAVAHYDDTGLVAADVVTGNDKFGIWVAGALRPGLDENRRVAVERMALSGDWRGVGGRQRLVAILGVNTPGFAIPSTRVNMRDDEPTALVAAGVVTDERVERWNAKQEEDGTIRVRKLKSVS